MKTIYWTRVSLAVLLGVVLLVGGLLGPALVGDASPVAAQTGDPPQPGTVVGVGTYTAYPQTALSATLTTAYSSAPYLYRGLDVSYSRNWNAADAFVTISGWESGEVITVTAQWSPDQSNWVDASYVSEGWVLPLSYSGVMTNSSVLTNSSGVTNTTTTTQTLTASASNTFSGSTGTRVSETVYYRVVPSADGTYVMRFPIAGMYLRYKIQYSGTLTATIKHTYRNN